MNFYCWIKPPAEDIDAFEKLGNPGWNWAEYEKYSKKSETCVIHSQSTISTISCLRATSLMRLSFHPPAKEQTILYPYTFDPMFRGTSGPVQVTIPPTVYTVDKLVQETLVNKGLKAIKDPYGGDV